MSKNYIQVICVCLGMKRVLLYTESHLNVYLEIQYI